MYHSITIGAKNTWDDWYLIPTSRPLFNPPKVKTKYVDIPGADGALDVTELLTGRPMYNNREGNWEFVIAKYNIDWATTYSEISEYLHGKWLTATLEDDPLYFYEGRFTVDSWKSEKAFSKIVIAYNVGPYKKLLSNPTAEGVL